MSEELDPDRISRLIADSAAGRLSAEEAVELGCWADSSVQNRQLLEALSDRETMWTATGEICSYDAGKAWLHVERRVRRRRMMRMVSPLAGMAVAVAVAVGIYVAGQQQAEPQLPLPQAKEVATVKLYRATGEVVVVDSERRIDLADAVVESNTEGMKVLSRSDMNENRAIYNTVEVGLQKTFDVTLSDGTQVTLNAGSSLRFPEQFAANASREVFLSGEAYFAVAKDEQRPFIVRAGGGYVRVTGTRFNVSCYTDAPAAVTTLVEGRVLVGGAGADSEVALTPGMQAAQDRKTGDVTTCNVNIAEFTAWKSGVFAFEERPLEEILASMGRWYGCGVVFENAICAAMRFSGQIARNCTLEEVAEFFRRTKELNIAAENGNLVVR